LYEKKARRLLTEWRDEGMRDSLLIRKITDALEKIGETARIEERGEVFAAASQGRKIASFKLDALKMGDYKTGFS
jgi:uncharacterized membrane protein